MSIRFASLKILVVAFALPLFAFARTAPPAKPFERLDACRVEPDKWTDGDSFRVRLADHQLETFRLYFVDTTESRSRGKRSDEQAAYFGITRRQAVELGKQAKTLRPRRSRSHSRFTRAGDVFSVARGFTQSCRRGACVCTEGLGVAARSIGHLAAHVTRLYEQGADSCRIGDYVQRWCGWLEAGLVEERQEATSATPGAVRPLPA